MSYRRALLTRWSRRDRLAVLVVAVTVAFLVGTTLLVLAAGAQTATIAAQFDSPGSVTAHDSPAAAAASDADAIVLPLGQANGTTVVGIPENASVGGVSLRDAVPPDWEVTAPGRVDATAGALAVHPNPSDGSARTGNAEGSNASSVTGAVRTAVPGEGVPLLSALAFFIAGTSQALVVVAVAAACGGLLVAVTTYSVTRMSVRDRRPTIRVVRATGGRPRTVLGLFAARAGLLTAVGVALGYAVGVIATNAAVNVAVATGLPTSLAVEVSPRAVRVLVPLFAALVAVGVGSGVAAAWRAARAPPGSLTDPVGGRTTDEGTGVFGYIRAAVRPRILGWRPLVPTAATLTAFVLFVGLAAGLAGVAAPISGGSGPAGGLVDPGTAASTTTIVQPGSTHPVSSQLPEGYADALRARGADASPEILLFEVVDGQPAPARGANYTAFARVTDADLVRGRAPQRSDEAIVGADAASTLDLAVGDRLLLGGSTRPAVTRVEVVGTFEAAGPFDDQVVVPLATARPLAGLGEGQVNLVRTTDIPDVEESGSGSGIGVTSLSTPDRVPADGNLSVTVTVRNDAPAEATESVTVEYRGTTRTVDVTLPPLRTTTRTVAFPAGSAGEATVRAGDASRTVTVLERDALALRGVPERAPPAAEPLVRVVNASNTPTRAIVTVANDTWNHSVSTGGNGRVRLLLPDAPGSYTVRATAPETTPAETTLVVAANATRQLDARLRVRPNAPSTLVRPTATLRLLNPWNRTLTRPVQLAGPGASLDRDVRLEPGAATTLEAGLARQPPGTYTVTADLGGGDQTVALNTTYRVTGDDRIVAALATSGRTGSSGIGQAIEVAFGNLGLLVGTLVVLAALMTVGGTTAAFAAAVAARRQTLGVYRATGATPARVARLVLADALRIGVVAAGLAVALASVALAGLGAADLLVVFGVRIGFPTPAVLLVCAASAVLLTLVAASLALVATLRAPPATLLADAGPKPPEGEADSVGRSTGSVDGRPARSVGGDDDD